MFHTEEKKAEIKALGVLLKNGRTLRKLSMRALGKLVGVNNATICDMEHGNYSPDFGVMVKISRVLSIPLAEFACVVKS